MVLGSEGRRVEGSKGLRVRIVGLGVECSDSGAGFRVYV